MSGGVGGPATPPGGESKACPDPDNTLIVLDWDDTLLPTSWLGVKGTRFDPAGGAVAKEVSAEVAALEARVAELLAAAVESGQVVIITNGEKGWVEMTAARFMPRVVPLLRSIHVLSARSAFEAELGSSPSAWKREAFDRVLRGSYEGRPGLRNIVSVGDSVYEREALIHTTRGWRNTLAKSIKFCERPTVELMTRQLDMLLKNFSRVISTTHNLDLMMAGEEAPPAPRANRASCGA